MKKKKKTDEGEKEDNRVDEDVSGIYDLQEFCQKSGKEKSEIREIHVKVHRMPEVNSQYKETENIYEDQVWSIVVLRHIG